MQGFKHAHTFPCSVGWQDHLDVIAAQIQLTPRSRFLVQIKKKKSSISKNHDLELEHLIELKKKKCFKKNMTGVCPEESSQMKEASMAKPETI